MKKQSGFTLIELVIVVMILGFLAVTAIPKFLDLTDQAQQANIEGMAGGFATGVSLARAQWEAEGRPQNASSINLVDYDGTTFYLTSEVAGSVRPGYPVGIDSDDTLANLDASDCIQIWQNILQQPPGVTSNITTLNNDDTMSYYVGQSSSGATALCHYYLKETLARDGSGNFVAPTTGATDVGNSFVYQASNSSVIVYINN